MFVPRIFHAVWGLRSSVRVESKLFLATPTYSIIPGIAVVRTICSSYTTRHGIALSTPAYSITVYQVPGTVVSLFRGFVIADVCLSRVKHQHGRWLCRMSTGTTNDVTLLVPQSRFGDKLLSIWPDCSHNGTAVLKGLMWKTLTHPHTHIFMPTKLGAVEFGTQVDFFRRTGEKKY